MKNLQYILCRNRERLVSKENEQLLLNIFCAETVKECAADIFYVEDCVAAFISISMFFKEHTATSEKILRKNGCF